MILTRRNILRGLVAMPAIVAASSLMPIRGLIMPLEPEAVYLRADYYGIGELAQAALRTHGPKIAEMLKRNNALLARIMPPMVNPYDALDGSDASVIAELHANEAFRRIQYAS